MIHHGNNIDILKTFEDNSIDSIVTDPPYGLSFMNKHWDYEVPKVELWKECLRVLKPGGHLLSFAGTRTYHRMTVNIEDAGFEIRDMISWIYGSGFPKSLDIGKAIDKRNGTTTETSKSFADYIKSERLKSDIGLSQADKVCCNGTTNYSWFEGRPAGQRLPRLIEYNKIKELLKLDNRFDEFIGEAEREIIGTKEKLESYQYKNNNVYQTNGDKDRVTLDITAPATPEAIKWNGFGTSLKPACEPICVARKPIPTTVAENVLKYGTGGINIDGCRIGTNEKYSYPNGAGGCKSSEFHYKGRAEKVAESHPQGRFPANIIFDEIAGVMLDEMSGESKSTGGNRNFEESQNDNPSRNWHSNIKSGIHHNDKGGASRFFYCAKSSKSERNGGLEGFEEIQATEMTKRKEGSAGLLRVRCDGTIGENAYAGKSAASQNHHPTVKPLKLMQYLVRLVTPKDGICLDPFAGSGTTLMACVKEGFDCIGIEREAEYVKIAEARVEWAKKQKDIEIKEAESQTNLFKVA